MQSKKAFRTVLVIIAGFLILNLFFKSLVLLYITMGIGVLSLLIPKADEFIATWWMKLSLVLGWINSRILLSLIFIFILCPLAFVYRISRKNPLLLKKKNLTTSFETRIHRFEANDLENPW